MKAKNFDKIFDNGEGVVAHLDLSRKRKSGLEQRRVNVDFPVRMINQLDWEAKRLGFTRQSVIKMWLAEKLKEAA